MTVDLIERLDALRVEEPPDEAFLLALESTLRALHPAADPEAAPRRPSRVLAPAALSGAPAGSAGAGAGDRGRGSAPLRRRNTVRVAFAVISVAAVVVAVLAVPRVPEGAVVPVRAFNAEATLPGGEVVVVLAGEALPAGTRVRTGPRGVVEWPGGRLGPDSVALVVDGRLAPAPDQPARPSAAEATPSGAGGDGATRPDAADPDLHPIAAEGTVTRPPRYPEPRPRPEPSTGPTEPAPDRPAAAQSRPEPSPRPTPTGPQPSARPTTSAGPTPQPDSAPTPGTTSIPTPDVTAPPARPPAPTRPPGVAAPDDGSPSPEPDPTPDREPTADPTRPERPDR